ncbi:hypothetical protein WOLCODRAFT_24839 [Wolfiporia cocos MD-104 SS10]|uniref:Uncharacterized protein n=1 Tax=Wolfiporia cocos (strain MD-104) TaxID=742152 RepID=A0A2H3JZI3_WOLCO|nr:hypothetical protein WOLCODRAFT_24839 [Wolfiporia cocos MD-104 SS10]
MWSVPDLHLGAQRIFKHLMVDKAEAKTRRSNSSGHPGPSRSGGPSASQQSLSSRAHSRSRSLDSGSRPISKENIGRPQPLVSSLGRVRQVQPQPSSVYPEGSTSHDRLHLHRPHSNEPRPRLQSQTNRVGALTDSLLPQRSRKRTHSETSSHYNGKSGSRRADESARALHPTSMERLPVAGDSNSFPKRTVTFAPSPTYAAPTKSAMHVPGGHNGQPIRPVLRPRGTT